MKKEIRNKIYKEAWKDSENDKNVYACISIARKIPNKCFDPSLVNKNNFPELFLFNRGDLFYDYAWLDSDDMISGTKSGDNLRRIVLQLCYEMTK